MSLLSEQDRAVVAGRLAAITAPVRLLFFTQTIGAPESTLVARQIVDEIASLSDAVTIEEVNFVLEKERAAQYGIADIPGLVLLRGEDDTRMRFLGAPAAVDAAKSRMGAMLDAETAQQLGLVTFALDDIDWEDEIRVFLEERASFSPDALTGLEANLRFAGPETMESKIFARLTAWQNWIFQRPNAVGEAGALKRYGSGQRPAFDSTRV